MSDSPIARTTVTNVAPGTVDGQTLIWDGGVPQWQPTDDLVVVGGNVGIGTATFDNLNKFVVAKSGASTNNPFLGPENTLLGLKNLSATAGNGSYISSLNSLGQTNAYMGFENTDGGFASAVVFGTATAGAATFGERLRIDDTGNVGIGTAAPDFSLDVQNAGFTQARFENTADTTCRITFNNTGQTNNNFIAIGAKSTALYFQTNNSEQMRIDAAGNVGIGTPTPSSKLQVLYSNSVAVPLADPDIGFTIQNSNAAGRASLKLASDAAQIMWGDGTGSYLAFVDRNATERMRIDASGNLLVNETTAFGSGDRKLQVRGSTDGQGPIAIGKVPATTTTAAHFIDFYVNVDLAATGNGAIVANGASNAAFAVFSDASIKTNIQPLQGELANILALKPCSFDFTDREGGNTGFIAQEMQAVYPDAVHEDPETELLMIAGWSKTEARLVKAIQELTARVEALEGA